LLIKFQPKNISITNQSVVLKKLDDIFRGYRLLQVSDFHLGTWINTRDMYEIVDLINQQEPDLIAITGDFISFDPIKYSKVLYNTLSSLNPMDGVVAVLGNHDHYTDAVVIRDALSNCGIIELNNSIHVIKRSSSRLIMAGIDDYMTRHADLDRVIEQIPDADDSVILLAHEPDFADISSESGRFAMQLSGHTHGGQICLPIFGNLYLPRYGRKYPSGYYQVNDMQLYTNRGIGTSWLKFRLNCPPEITIFELTNLGGQ
jgi:predicted MPP superfamily phosphohydrolase